jgi:hypothetical protein
LLRLVDAAGNLADGVDFRARGDWPSLAHGGGSSLELIHPWADNSLGSAWRDSDESGKAGWKTCACTNTYLELLTMGRPSDYRELHLFLAGRGHVALRNIGLWKDGVNTLDNPARMSMDGSGTSGWLALGTHWASFVTNGELHLVAEGRGDNRPNHVEIDCLRLQRGGRYELRFEARWIAGSSRLIAQTWDHSFGGSFLIERPKQLGTPGAKNSVTGSQTLDLAQAPPQVDGLRHSPAVPRSTNAVKITARVTSASPLRSVRLLHRLDKPDGDAPWAGTPMFDDGKNGGDAAPGDGVFTTELNEYGTNGIVVQFYLQATAANGQVSTQPRRGAEWPALYVVDDRRVRRDLRTDRFILSAYDLGSMGDGGTAKHGFHHPRLSNHRYNVTFIANEERVFYGGEIRVSGSGFTRGSDLGKAKWQLPNDRPFRGRTEFYYDNDNNLHNRIARYLLYQLGHVTSEAEWTRVIINNTGPYLKQDTEPVTDAFLDRNFKDGSRGELYRIDDEWWFTDSGGRNNQDASWDYKGTDDPARYRAEWQKRTRETEDDYSGLIALFKTYSANRFTQDEIERILDPHAILQMAAARAFMNDWDSFTLDRGKNGFLYRRPSDGRFQFLHWDSDLAFRDFSAPFSGERVQNWIEKPYNKRLLYYYLLQLIDLTKSPRFLAWLQMEQTAGALRQVNAAFYLSFFEMRGQFAVQTMGRHLKVPFAITLGPGQSLTTPNESFTLTGTAPYGVFNVVLDGHPPTRVTWIDEVTWLMSDIPSQPGENVLKVRAVDHNDKVLQETTVRVTRNGSRGRPG